MSIFVFFLSMILTFGFLWLAAKFLGSMGLIIFSMVESVLLLVAYHATFNMFGLQIPLILLHFVLLVYFAFYFYTKHNTKECFKYLICVGGTVLFAGLAMTILYAFAVNFAAAWESYLAPTLVLVFALAVTFGVAFVIQKFVSSFKKKEMKNFLNMCSSASAGALIYVSFIGMGYFSFGNICLAILLTILWSIIILAILFFCERFLISICDDRDFFEPVSQTLNRWLKPESRSSSKSVKVQVVTEEQKESAEDKVATDEEIVVEVEKTEEKKDEPIDLDKYFISDEANEKQDDKRGKF